MGSPPVRRASPARWGHRFLFRKKAVGKNGPGDASPGTPSKVRPDGLGSSLCDCKGPLSQRQWRLPMRYLVSLVVNWLLFPDGNRSWRLPKAPDQNLSSAAESFPGCGYTPRRRWSAVAAGGALRGRSGGGSVLVPPPAFSFPPLSFRKERGVPAEQAARAASAANAPA